MTTIFNKTTGKILCSSEHPMPTHVLDTMLTPETDFIDGYHLADLYYIANKTPTLIPSRPSDDYDFNWQSHAWELNMARLTESVLAQRKTLLLQSDWTQLPDVPLATKEAWVVYRQALRDITEQPGFPESVVWPKTPDE